MLDIFFINNYNAIVISKLGLTFIVKETLNMASIEQKRADLEKALRAIEPNEMEAVAGGMSKGAQTALKVAGGIAAAALGGAAIGAGIYFGGDRVAKAIETSDKDKTMGLKGKITVQHELPPKQPPALTDGSN